jgi:hypothetical protein
MTRLLKKLFAFIILVFILTLLQKYTVAQVTSVKQLSDVNQSSWSLRALSALVDYYGCKWEYPDKTFRGNRAATRYEVAFSLNSCFISLNELSAGARDSPNVEEVLKLEKLQESLGNERSNLQNRINALQSQIIELEN